MNRLRNERTALLNQSRSNDSPIAANAKHLESSEMALNEQQNALEQIYQRRTDLQHDIELANTRRESIVQSIDDLQAVANQSAIVKENLHLLELEKTSLRKELDFQVKIARKPSSTPEQAVRNCIAATRVLLIHVFPFSFSIFSRRVHRAPFLCRNPNPTRISCAKS